MLYSAETGKLPAKPKPKVYSLYMVHIAKCARTRNTEHESGFSIIQ